MRTIATIGYEGATVQTFVHALVGADIDLLIDVRAVAASRRPGFAKTRLAAHLEEAGIGYLHLRDLGTPPDGRIAARAGHHAVMRDIVVAHLRTIEAREHLDVAAELLRSGRHVALMCLEADPAHCHRSLVAAALVELVPARIRHLRLEAWTGTAAPWRPGADVDLT